MWLSAACLRLPLGIALFTSIRKMDLKKTSLPVHIWCGGSYLGAPGCITCVGVVPRGSSPIARQQQQHNFGDLPSRSITMEHFGKCPELMSTCRATMSQLPCLICSHHSCWGESLFPFVLAHPLLSQVFLCSPLSSAGEGSRLPLQTLYCRMAFPGGYAGRVNPKHVRSMSSREV